MPFEPRRPAPATATTRPTAPARGTPAQLAPSAGAPSRPVAPHVQAALQAAAGPRAAAGAAQARLSGAGQAVQLMKKSKNQRKHERKLKNHAKVALLGEGFPGSVTTGAKTFACFNITMLADGNLSANFSQPFPSAQDLVAGTICTITTAQGTYSGHLFQVDRHPYAYVRGNFDNVKVKK